MAELETIRNQLSRINGINLNENSAYERIRKVIEELGIAIPSYVFPNGINLFRCREHENENDFTNESDISYRRDIDGITEFGRANEPHQSIFYCGDVRPTSILETSQIVRGESNINIDKIIITTGHWITEAPLKLAVIAHSQEARERNDLINSHGVNIDELTKELFPDDFIKILETLKYFSNAFAKNRNRLKNGYKISCAFAHFAYMSNDGIVYPSLQRNYEGLNFALKPEIVDNNLRLIAAKKDTFHKRRHKEYVNTEYKDTLSVNNESILWGPVINTGA